MVTMVETEAGAWAVPDGVQRQLEECESCGGLTQVLSNDPDAALVCDECSQAPNGEVA